MEQKVLFALQTQCYNVSWLILFSVEAVMAAYDRLSAEFDEDACLAVDVDELKNAKEVN